MSKVETGAKLELRISGIPVAYANNVQYSIEHLVAEIQGIDSIQIAEHAEVGSKVTFTASMFRVANKAAVTNGWMPKLDKLLQQPELTAVIRSKVSRAGLLTVSGLKCTGRSGSIDARGAWVETLTFVGRIAYDEAS